MHLIGRRFCLLVTLFGTIEIVDGSLGSGIHRQLRVHLCRDRNGRYAQLIVLVWAHVRHPVKTNAKVSKTRFLRILFSQVICVGFCFLPSNGRDHWPSFRSSGGEMDGAPERVRTKATRTYIQNGDPFHTLLGRKLFYNL